MEHNPQRWLRVLETDDVDVVVPHVVPQVPDVALEQADVGADSCVNHNFAARQVKMLVLGGLSMNRSRMQRPLRYPESTVVVIGKLCVII